MSMIPIASSCIGVPVMAGDRDEEPGVDPYYKECRQEDAGHAADATRDRHSSHTLAGLNIPVQIGGATEMPGDAVLGTPPGVLFIPAHLAAQAARESMETRLRDSFAKLRLAEGRYSTSQMDVEVWAAEIQNDYDDWCANASDRVSA
jgi:hypothetical protein